MSTSESIPMTSIDPSSKFYHFEYTNIHNQRIALAGYIQLWHQIGWPAAILVFGFLVRGSRPYVPFLGALLASAVVWFVRIHTWTLDAAILRLYPRLIFLELVLGFDFHRGYVRALGKGEADWLASAEQAFKNAPNTAWENMRDPLAPGQFRRWRRGHVSLDLAALVLTIAFFGLALCAARGSLFEAPSNNQMQRTSAAQGMDARR